MARHGSIYCHSSSNNRTLLPLLKCIKTKHEISIRQQQWWTSGWGAVARLEKGALWWRRHNKNVVRKISAVKRRCHSNCSRKSWRSRSQFGPIFTWTRHWNKPVFSCLVCAILVTGTPVFCQLCPPQPHGRLTSSVATTHWDAPLLDTATRCLGAATGWTTVATTATSWAATTLAQAPPWVCLASASCLSSGRCNTSVKVCSWTNCCSLDIVSMLLRVGFFVIVEMSNFCRFFLGVVALSGVSQPKIVWGGPKNWGEGKCLILGEQQHFVWDTAFISIKWLDQVFLRHFRDPIRVPRIRENYDGVPKIRENRVPRIRENRVPRIREIGSLQIHTGYLTFSLKKNLD